MRTLPRILSCGLSIGLSLSAQAPPAPSLLPPDDVSLSTQPAAVAPRTTASDEIVLRPAIRNITRLHNSMPHLLTGLGLVTGLANTGSSDKGTRQAMLNFVREHDLNLSLSDLNGGTTALVSITAALPPFAKEGMQLDVKVEVLTDTTSLKGGELLRAELLGVDGRTYVVAQGALVVAGVTANTATASVQKNTSTTAWLPNGGLVIREEGTSYFSESGALELQLLNPSPFNSSSVASGMKAALSGTSARVTAVDPTLVRIELPDVERTNENAQRIINLVGAVRVPVENPAKILIDQASGSVLAGYGVMISPCVVGLSDITIAVTSEDQISQPNPLSGGTTERIGRSRVEVQTKDTGLKGIDGGTVADLLQNLKALSLTPSQLVSVFLALDQGGYLHGALEVR